MWKNHKWKFILPLILAAVLTAAFFSGGKTSREKEPETVHAEPAAETAVSAEQARPEKVPEEPEVSLPVSAETAAPPTEPAAPEPAASEEPAVSAEPEEEQQQTEPEQPLPVEPQDAAIGPKTYTCTLSISCAAILDNMELCDPEKAALVPSDGCILAPLDVPFYEGESVFNVLQRTCKQQGIHMEFMNMPVYNSAYIEGIANLYEFDVGELSGWMYRVNGWFPNYGCSRYALKDGDTVEWIYTCDLGADIGGGDASQREE